MDDITKFLNIVTDINGKIYSKRLTRKYFERIDKVDLFDNFISVTSHSDKSLTDKINLALNGYIDEYPTCKICGKPVMVMRKVISQYCSKSCALLDLDRAKKISETKLNSCSTESNNKRRKTMVEKYGCEYNSQRKDIHNIWTKSKLTEIVYSKLSNREWLYNEYVIKQRTATSIANELGINYTTVIDYCNKFNINIHYGYSSSEIEHEISSFLFENLIEHKTNYVGLYNDKREVDLYIPSHSIAIEVNGLYWHTEKFKNKNYHYDKLIDLSNEIRLIQFTDKQWFEYKEICKSIILSSLNKYKIFNDNIIIKQYTNFNDEIVEFFNLNCINGFTDGDLYVILKSDDRIVCGAIFSETKDYYQLLRFTTLNYSHVNNAFDKIVKMLDENKSIQISIDLAIDSVERYKCNRTLYFVKHEECYYWTNGNTISEKQLNDKFYKYYSCGKDVYVLKNNGRRN